MDLPLLGGDISGLATGGAADAFPVFSSVVEPAFRDASKAAPAAAAGLLPSFWVKKIGRHSGSW